MALDGITGRSSVDYMLRTTQQHHVQLSAMADQKANIIVAFSSVVFTVSLTQVGSISVRWGFYALALTSAIALVTSILSLMPRFERAKNRRVDIPLNPLFFGHYTEWTEDEYLRQIATVIESDDRTYEAIARDIYQIGQILRKKKYFYLGLSYRVFLVGTLVSIVVFGVEVLVS